MLTSSFGALIHKHCGSQRTKTHSPNIQIKTASILTCFMISVESQIWITAPYSNVTWVTIGRWFEGAWERMSPSLLAKWTQCFALVNLPPSPLYPLEAESMKEHRGCLDDCVHSLCDSLILCLTEVCASYNLRPWPWLWHISSLTAAYW